MGSGDLSEIGCFPTPQNLVPGPGVPENPGKLRAGRQRRYVFSAYATGIDRSLVPAGGPVIKSGDPVEQEKQLKYASPVANTIMLSNVTDLTSVLSSMAEDGITVTPNLVARLSPYTREHVRRLGRYVLDMDDLPEPLNPQPLPFENAL